MGDYEFVYRDTILTNKSTKPFDSAFSCTEVSQIVLLKFIYTLDDNQVQSLQRNKMFEYPTGHSLHSASSDGENNGSDSISKRYRPTVEQARMLEEKFCSTPYLNKIERRLLSKELKMPSEKVQLWFQNRRAREKLKIRLRGGSEEDLMVLNKKHWRTSYIEGLYLDSENREWSNTSSHNNTNCASPSDRSMLSPAISHEDAIENGNMEKMSLNYILLNNNNNTVQR